MKAVYSHLARRAYSYMENWPQLQNLFSSGGYAPLGNHDLEYRDPNGNWYSLPYDENVVASEVPQANGGGGAGAPSHAWQGFQAGLWYPGMGGTVPFGQGGLSVIGGMFDFGGTSSGGVLPAGWSPFWGGGFYNAGGAAGSAEMRMEGGKKPEDL